MRTKHELHGVLPHLGFTRSFAGRLRHFGAGADCPRVEPAEIDLILVPGTAFDVRGHRIGQGGGYYDRYLNRTRAVRVGVCHDFALLSAVPSEAHDARMDIVVTPGRTVIIREETT